MDGAWALYEAWVLLQEGEIDAALVYSFGRSSLGDLNEILALQLDPYYLAPLWPDPVSLAALQARALIDAGKATEADFAAIAARSRKDALANPKAQVAQDDRSRAAAGRRLRGVPAAPPRPAAHHRRRRRHRAGRRRQGGRGGRSDPAWITGIDHRIETHALGARDLTVSPSTAKAAEVAGVADGPVDVAELHAPYAHQELIVQRGPRPRRLGGRQPVGRSAGRQPAHVGRPHPHRRGGRPHRARARPGRAVAHATSGPCLQQNLVCVLEGA